MPRNIQYAFHKSEGLVVSRVGSELAWPVLDYEAIGQNGDYTAPLKYPLEKMSVVACAAEYGLLVFTKYVPVPIKNEHRKFWGMKELPVPPLPQTINELCRQHHQSYYYTLPAETAAWGTRVVAPARVGVLHKQWGDTTASLYHWFVKTPGGFVLYGVSDTADETHKGADRQKVTSEQLTPA